MFNWIRGLFLSVCVVGPALAEPDLSALGRPASPADIALWDIDVRYDGQGLPPGEGTAEQGAQIFAESCASCHGDFGEGVGRNPALMGGEESLRTAFPKKTVGSFWPYAPVLYDYIYRAMPFGNAQSLSADETYALVAYILDLNFIDLPGGVANAQTLPQVEMPNRDGFFVSTEQPDTKAEACMSDCRPKPTVKGTADFYGVGIKVPE